MKVDVLIRKPMAFPDSGFHRRAEVELLGTRVFVATAEDTVISKLSWALASGGSELGLADLWRQVTTGRGKDDLSLRRGTTG